MKTTKAGKAAGGAGSPYECYSAGLDTHPHIHIRRVKMMHKQGQSQIPVILEGMDLLLSLDDNDRKLSFTALLVNITLRFLRLIHNLIWTKEKNAIKWLLYLVCFHYCLNKLLLFQHL